MPAFYHTDTANRNLRDLSGYDMLLPRDYVPQVHTNGDFVFQSRTFSIYLLKYRGLTESSDPSMRELLRERRSKWLQTNYNLTKSAADLFVRRRKQDINRVEDLIHSIIDATLLFDTNLFSEKEGKKRLRGIIRKVLIIGSYNVGQVISYWKELSSFLYNKGAGILPALPVPSNHNFCYRYLRDWPKILRIVNQDIDRALLESTAHLLSTRHMPSGDRRTEEKALGTFIRNIEEPYTLDVNFLNLIHRAAMRVGEKCVSLGGRIVTLPHISLSCAGSYYHTVSQGGRGKEIRDALHRILTVRPLDDESIETPFGLLCCPAGEERWRYWTRSVPYSHYPDIPFGEPIIHEVFAELHPFYQGFDEAIGNQIVVAAYLDYSVAESINCRILTVPEPGGKARIVTTGPYWLNILQQSLAHSLKDVLRQHPSARSSLSMTDQAWQCLYLMSNKEYPEDFQVLSSDLKEATDHIPKEVAVHLLTGFIEGCGFRSRLIETCLDLLRRDRNFIGPGYVSLKQTRGVMMGEPLCKVILTIQNLVVEEIAMRTHLGVNFSTSFYDSPSWRSYHIGGDDHIAVGPIGYLREITNTHIRMGSKISPGKHGMSKIFVTYCEKLIYVRNIYQGFDVRKINDPVHYPSSPFIDSVKMRLLSPATKSFDVVSDRNIAIGKGLSLGRTLRWLNPTSYSKKWVRMARARFFQRMGSLIPDRTSGVYWQLLLPTHWGGLDMWTDEDLPDLYTKLPKLTLSIMERSHQGAPEAHNDVELLRKFLTNASYRGFRLNETEVEAMRTHVETIVKRYLPSSTWRALVSEYDPNGEYSAKSTADRIYADGWMLEEDIYDELLRPILFKEILLGQEKPQPYNTVRLKTRYAKLWDLAYCGTPTISYEEFVEVLRTRPVGMYYRVAYPEDMHFVSDRGYLYKSALDDALNGMPVLRTNPPFF